MATPSILILTQLDDIHAAAVALGAEATGAHVTTLLCGDFPRLQAASVTIGRARCDAEIVDGGGVVRGRALDAVWYRRPTRPRLPESMHPGDLLIAEQECAAFVQGLHDVLAPEAVWVNPPAGARAAGSKLRQLELADAIGLRVPETLASNDPHAIRAFLRRHEGPVIYKTFRPALWESGDHVAYAFTAPVTVDELPDDEVLRLTPGIFQPLVPKAYELRLTMMGRTCIGARLRSQEHAEAGLDWRAGGIEVPVEPYAVDLELQRRCRELMQRLGIVFGCLDFVVTPDGEPIFLEVNEAGQWLWLEECCPELPLLDAFVALLATGPTLAYLPAPGRLRFEDVRADALALLDAQRARHVAHSTWPVAPDHALPSSGLSPEIPTP
jgi:hypothetical protein